mmetsp:Transcript_61245/g.169526  ORF Transcript_61245/g.169526 Transcript_61245/m.169526 type:complete len:94 (-) Transcript_61245:125-406(-)
MRRQARGDPRPRRQHVVQPPRCSSQRLRGAGAAALTMATAVLLRPSGLGSRTPAATPPSPAALVICFFPRNAAGLLPVGPSGPTGRAHPHFHV